jgi:hypothetical protein
MKPSTAYIYITIIAILSLFSCLSDNANKDSVEVIKTRALPNSTSEEELESTSPSSLSRKWEFGEEFIDLDKEGAFEAILDGKHYTGKWGLSNGKDDVRTLKLIGKEDVEGSKEESFKRSYELINVSYERLVAVDSAGNKINFFPEN